MSDLAVQLLTTRHYAQNERDEMVSEVRKYGFEVTEVGDVFKKSAITTPDVVLVLGWLLGVAATAYVGGFFQKMGGDTWDHVKEALLDLFENKNEVGHPRLMIKIPVTEMDYLLCFIVESDKKEVEKALEVLPKFIEECKIKIEDVDYRIPLYYYEGKWSIPGWDDGKESENSAE